MWEILLPYDEAILGLGITESMHTDEIGLSFKDVFDVYLLTEITFQLMNELFWGLVVLQVWLGLKQGKMVIWLLGLRLKNGFDISSLRETPF